MERHLFQVGELPKVSSKEDFNKLVTEIESQPGYRKPIGFGICRVDRGQLNPERILQATFPVVNWKENYGSAAVFIAALQYAGADIDFSDSEQNFFVDEKFLEYAMAAFVPFLHEAAGDKHRNVQLISSLIKKVGLVKSSLAIGQNLDTGIREEIIDKFKISFLFEDVAVKSVEAGYLKLYALSTRKAPLRSLNLDGIFGVLHNCAWSNGKPYELDYLRDVEITMKLADQFPHIDFVDKFPRFLQHIIPADNTRILSSHNVRFGAQLGAGTTVMPGASYINFNAGTEGVSMVEGRISSSAAVGENSDVGGGSSIIGVLSGGNSKPMSLGKNSLLGINSVMGIPLGDEVTLSAGVAIMPGTFVAIDPKYKSQLRERNPDIDFDTVTKGEDICGINRALILPDEKGNGVVIKWNKKPNKLNPDLH